MRAVRRLLQVAALVGTLMVGILSLALIVSQTPWFRDWVRRYIVRESKQYLNGELSIGNISGNLLFGVQVSDIAVDVSGERVIAAKNLQVDYSIIEIIRKGVVINEIKLVAPAVRLERDAQGWNLARLVKEQAEEAERKGPGAPLALQSIELVDASVTIADSQAGTSGYQLPARIEDLDLKASYEYAPVHYTVVVDRASFRASSPELQLTALQGKVAVRDDNLYVDQLSIRTGESSMNVDGVVEDYLGTPVLKVTTTGQVSLPEIGRIVTAARGYELHPAIDVKASGPIEKLGLDIDLKSEAGNIRGVLTADVGAPALGVQGEATLERLNLAPLLKDPAQRSDITGRAELDLRVSPEPQAAPITDRLAGTFTFTGPGVTAAGYTARDVRVSGSFEGSRLTLDGRAAAYGGTATAKGFIGLPAEGRPLAFDLRGRADRVNLQDLPAETGAPALSTKLSVAEYRVTGSGGTISGTVRLNESVVEGATLADGTAAEFKAAPAAVTFGARGNVSGLNLPRIGKAMKIAALDDPAYDGTINGDFDVTGTLPKSARPSGGTSDAAMTIDATGTLRDSTIMGGRLPELGFETHLAQGGLTVAADGRFEDFNPATLAKRQDLEGNVSGTLDVRARVDDIEGPITPEAIVADGSVTLERSEVGGLRIDSASVEGKYAQQVADLARLQVSGPDLKVDASGRVALDRTSASNLTYHVEAIGLSELAELAGQEGVSGSAVLDGTLTGNAASLETTGTLDGSNLGYQENTALDLNTKYTVTIPELTFADAAVKADTTATFLKAGGLEINALTATTTYGDDRVSFTTKIQEKTRELTATGDVILHTDHQEVHLPDLVVRTNGVEWRTAATLPPDQMANPAAASKVATIKYGQDRLELENVRLVSGDQSLDLDGAFALKGEAPAGDIKVRAQNVDLQQLEQLMLLDRGLSGRLSAEATVSGTAASPKVDGHVEVRNGTFQTYKYDALTADVAYSGPRIVIDATLQQSPTEAIMAKGSVPTSLFQGSPTGDHVEESAADRIDLHVTSTALNLGVIQGFTTQITNVTGTLEADVRVTGSGQDPHVQGFLDIKGGAFGVPAVGTSFTGLNTRIELQPDVVRLQKFAILDENGQPLNVSGELAVHARQVGAVNISIDSNNFEIIDNELGDVGIDSKLTITGELRRPVVKGDVRLQAGRLEVDKILQLLYDPYAVEELPAVVSAERSVEGSGSAEEATTAALRRAEATAAVPAPEAAAADPAAAKDPAAATDAAPGDVAAAAPESALAPVTLDVRVVIPDNLVLRGKKLRPGGPTGASLGDINLTVGGDIRIVKEPGGEIRLLGTIETVRGTYDFQGRRFELVRGGTLRFLGEPKPNPTLDISATRVIPNTGVEATVKIQGTAEAPQLSLTSSPPLPESDILALIVFNRPVNELGTGEKASLAATAGGIATGFIAAPLGDSIGRALDLDLFEITTTTEEGDLGAGITVGQQFGERAFLKVRQQFGERSVTEFLLDYQLADFLRLQTTAAPETSGSANRIGQRRIERAGIDLIFFFSY